MTNRKILISCKHVEKEYESKRFFQIELDELELDKLRFRSELGFNILRSHHDFLDVLATQLTIEILRQLHSVSDGMSEAK